MTANAPDIAIIGGGVVGCALAYDLARQGAAVSLYESGKLATEASWASAGIISAPAPRYGANTELAIISFQRYTGLIAEIEELSGVSTGWNPTGQMLPGDSDSAADLETIRQWHAERGIASELLDKQGLREREPGLSAAFDRGLYVPGGSSVLLDRVTVALARSATHHGATIHEHTPVLGIETERGKASGVHTIHGTQPAGAVVIAAGAWSSVLGESIDHDIPTMPVRGQMVAISDAPVPINAVIAAEGIYLVPRADGTVAVGATEEADAGFDKSVTPAGLRWLTDRIEKIAPTLVDGRIHATWAGLRPGSRDGLPIIGRVPHLQNVWVATGHFRSGALLAPATSQLLAASMLSGQVDERLSAFDPARFA